MKTILLSILGAIAFAALTLAPAYGNHRTGSFALPELIAAGDFDRDGNLDLAVNVTGFDNVTLFRGDGAGGFTLYGHVGSDTLTKGLAVADLDGDGLLDFAGCAAWGYDLIIHKGDGLGGFGHRDLVYNGDGEPTRLVIGDFNNDRRPDIAMNGPDEGIMLVYLNDRKGGFRVPPVEIAGIPHSFGLAAADFNGDGNLDLAVTSIANPITGAGSSVFILLGDGTGQFTVKEAPAVNAFPTSVQAGDLNNDGKVDLVVGGAQPTNQTGNYINTLLGDGTGHFVLKQTITLGAGSLKGEIALGDFDENGKLDLCYPVTSLQISHDQSTSLLLFFGDGTGNLVPGPILTVEEEPHTVVAVDLNKDGHLDLVNSNRTSGTISILLGDGHGNFGTPLFYSVVK